MDPKLRLKPIELIDIGIDKLTKIPLPILNDNLVSTFNLDNGMPSDSMSFTFDANYSNKYLSMTLVSDYNIVLSFDYGDGSFIQDMTITPGGIAILHEYPSAITYTINIAGWLDRLKSLSILPYGPIEGGITAAFITGAKSLSYLDLSGNRLTSLDLNNLIYLNSIKLDNNYFPNDIIDDLYIEADTFLTLNGYMSTVGANNGIPSVYSTIAINSLKVYKNWTLNYNT